MEKKVKKPRTPRVKKPIDLNINLGKVDIHVKRDETGDVAVDVDSNVIDVHIEKDENGLHMDVELDDKLIYSFISNGKSKHMGKGIFQITGEMVKIFLKQGFGTLKK